MELDSSSAEALESLLTETPTPVRVGLAVPATARRPAASGARQTLGEICGARRGDRGHGKHGVVLSEIATRFGISRQRVSQVIRASESGPTAAEGERAKLTPEELLDAHAALVETWRSAQTAGVKAGATRRIRKIEAAMADRGVEFQPAPVSRSRGPSAAPSTPEQLLAARAVWIEAREVAETGGQRQGASRRIRTIERELRARGIEFEPADLGRPPRRSAPAPLTPEELLDAHAALVEGSRIGADARCKAGRDSADPEHRGGPDRSRHRVRAG